MELKRKLISMLQWDLQMGTGTIRLSKQRIYLRYRVVHFHLKQPLAYCFFNARSFTEHGNTHPKIEREFWAKAQKSIPPESPPTKVGG